MGVGSGLYMCDVVVKSSRSLSHLLMSSCCSNVNLCGFDIIFVVMIAFVDLICDTCLYTWVLFTSLLSVVS